MQSPDAETDNRSDYTSQRPHANIPSRYGGTDCASSSPADYRACQRSSDRTKCGRDW